MDQTGVQFSLVGRGNLLSVGHGHGRFVNNHLGFQRGACAVLDVAFLKQKLSKVRAVLAGETGDKGTLGATVTDAL